MSYCPTSRQAMEPSNSGKAQASNRAACPYHGPVLSLRQTSFQSGKGLDAMRRFMAEGPHDQASLFNRPDTGLPSTARGCTCTPPGSGRQPAAQGGQQQSHTSDVSNTGGRMDSGGCECTAATTERNEKRHKGGRPDGVEKCETRNTRSIVPYDTLQG